MPGGLFARLRSGLEKTREGLVGQIKALAARTRKLDDDFFDQLEETLILADIGVEATTLLVHRLKEDVKAQRLNDPARVVDALKGYIFEKLSRTQPQIYRPMFPAVWMVVGVNGVGKTTTIGKLASRFTESGRKVILGASDTFRAAAIDQLQIWSERAGCELVKHQENSDPAAVAFDTLQAANARRADLAVIDTAGRLHTRVNLMEELRKVYRVVQREAGERLVEVILVLDATTGQNAVSQARLFREAVNVTGVVLTKLDGTAKGGIVVAIADTLGLPVRYIGVGERQEDLREFDPGEFVDALFD